MRRTVVTGVVLAMSMLWASGAHASHGRPTRDRAAGTPSGQARADAGLDVLLQRLVATRGGPPGIGVVVDRGAGPVFHTAGVAEVGTNRPFALDDHLRTASVAKAFSGATALALVADGRLSLQTTIGQRRPDLPQAWWAVTLRELLNHTSGTPDFTEDLDFQEAAGEAPLSPPPPRQLLSFVEDEPLRFPPGSQYRYSNSDNIVVGLMVEAATGRPYEQVLQERVIQPLGLTQTSLPRDATLPPPFIHGYLLSPFLDVSEIIAMGWFWASGGMVSTPRDLNTFIRAYAAGATTNQATRAAQFRFVEGRGVTSVPPGPGRNSAGLAIFRYETACGTVYGHTGSFGGWTHFVAATADGSRSTTVSLNASIVPQSDRRNFPLVREIFLRSVCAALA